ncbi:CAAD domains of cyanobacterial aminoacyl-tRNA synthetase-domain-containing protein [Scenedesmus sp. NREL 46B-D3]|nr:CAAD domains of cyanobacterial aminoacyl-tRNA synthetase-domain-containing protein [Scenedesmus sp. NREL 46B-D3]
MALLTRTANAGLVARTQRPALVGLKAGLPVRRGAAVAVKAANNELDTEDINKKLNESLSNTTTYLQTKWEETEDKPAAVAVTGGILLLLVAANSVVDAVDRIPIVSDLIELVGIVVTGWFTYRYLVFGPDREELVSNFKAFLNKVYGK